jgi:hypothetical protein
MIGEETMTISSRYLFTMTMKGERQMLEGAPRGSTRVISITQAEIIGPRINASLLPGGSDWVRIASDGSTMLNCRMVFRTSDGALFGVRYEGIRHGTPEVIDRINRGEPFEATEIYHRVAMFFETGTQEYFWLNHILAVGFIRYGDGGPAYEVYEIM